jgi:hypothetical protein
MDRTVIFHISHLQNQNSMSAHKSGVSGGSTAIAPDPNTASPSSRRSRARRFVRKRRARRDRAAGIGVGFLCTGAGSRAAEWVGPECRPTSAIHQPGESLLGRAAYSWRTAEWSFGPREPTVPIAPIHEVLCRSQISACGNGGVARLRQCVGKSVKQGSCRTVTKCANSSPRWIEVRCQHDVLL